MFHKGGCLFNVSQPVQMDNQLQAATYGREDWGWSLWLSTEHAGKVWM